MECDCYKSGTRLLSKWHIAFNGILLMEYYCYKSGTNTYKRSLFYQKCILVECYYYKSGTRLLSKWHGFVIQVAQNALVTY